MPKAKSRTAAASESDAKAKKSKQPTVDDKKKSDKKTKADKVKPEKVIRDSFTMPKSDYALIDILKKKCLSAGVAVKKSELLRAGLAALDGMPNDVLLQAVKSLAAVKTGRPSDTKKKKPA
jgi:hypothetical protein